MERARFPMEFLRVTQGPNTGSHAGSKAMDFGGKDTGKDPTYAPFTGKFVRVRKDSSHESYLESLEPVEFANGVVDYLTRRRFGCKNRPNRTSGRENRR